MASNACRILVVLAAVGACSKSGPDRADHGEQSFVEKELGELRAALAARSESGVLVGCITATTSLERMPAAVAGEIRRLCFVEAPRLYLEEAVAAAREIQDPNLAELRCMHLTASDAFEVLADHPPTDPALQAAIDAYTQLCPEHVAKLRARR